MEHRPASIVEVWIYAALVGVCNALGQPHAILPAASPSEYGVAMLGLGLLIWATHFALLVFPGCAAPRVANIGGVLAASIWLCVLGLPASAFPEFLQSGYVILCLPLTVIGLYLRCGTHPGVGALIVLCGIILVAVLASVAQQLLSQAGWLGFSFGKGKL